MTDKQFQRRMQRAERKNTNRVQRQKIKDAGRGSLHIETSKLLAIYLFVLLNVIVIYAMVVMAITNDLSALPVLISDIAAQVIVYAIYCAKAFKGKQAEEDIKLERDKLGLFADEPEDDSPAAQG